MKLFLQTRSFLHQKRDKIIYDEQIENNIIQIDSKQPITTK